MKYSQLGDYYDTDGEIEVSDLFVDRVPYPIAKQFLREWHYSGGSGNAIMPWGCYLDGSYELIGVIAFQTPISEAVRDSIFGPGICDCDNITERDRTMPGDCSKPDCQAEADHHHYGQHVTGLHRVATKDKAPKNTESWFISQALKRLKAYKPKYRAVVTFADPTEGHRGTIYQATNALYFGQGEPRTYYEDPDGRLRPPRQCGVNIDTEQASERGWRAVEREGKHRYLFLLPDPYQPKDELREQLQIEIHDEYP